MNNKVVKVAFCISIILFAFLLKVQAQLVDTISEAVKAKPKLSIRLDNRYSFIAATP